MGGLRVSGAVIVAVALVVPGGVARGGAAARTNVVVGADQDPGGLNPAVACCGGVWSTWMGPAEALRGAFVQTPNGRWVPGVVSSAAATASGITYTIANGANWYWGGRKVPVTYRDFVYTLRQLVAPGNQVVDRRGYLNIDPSRITHRGSKQVTFRWRTTGCGPVTPCGPYGGWQRLFSTIYPSFALRGMDFETMWSNCICGVDGKPVADGPYYLSAFADGPGQGATLHANPYWYGPRPAISEIDFRTFPDVASEVQALENHEVDLIVPPFSQSLEPLKNAAGVHYAQAPGLSVEQVAFREGPGASNALLRAPFVREAIAMSIDRNAVVAAVFGDLAAGVPPANSVLASPSQVGYRRSFNRWNYNPKRAIALMSAHCTGGPASLDPSNTAIWQCSGLPATFSWSWPSGDTAGAVVEAIAKAELRAVGIGLVDRPMPPNVFYGSTGIASGAFDVAEFPVATSGDPSDWAANYGCGGASNVTGFCSRAVDRLIGEAARGTSRLPARLVLADTQLAKAVPTFPLYAQPVVLARSAQLEGPTPSPGQFGPFWNVERWSWRR